MYRVKKLYYEIETFFKQGDPVRLCRRQIQQDERNEDQPETDRVPVQGKAERGLEINRVFHRIPFLRPNR